MTDEVLECENTTFRRGFPVWSHNPSASDVTLRPKEKSTKLEHGKNVLLINCETSEILGEGTAGFFHQESVDDAQFMKVYIGKLDSMFQLTKTGQRIFQIVWDQVQQHKDQDIVSLKPMLAKFQNKLIPERTFQRGVRELLEKKFIFMGPVDGVYYINMGIYFNGNRIISATEYIKTSSPKSLKGAGNEH